MKLTTVAGVFTVKHRAQKHKLKCFHDRLCLFPPKCPLKGWPNKRGDLKTDNLIGRQSRLVSFISRGQNFIWVRKRDEIWDSPFRAAFRFPLPISHVRILRPQVSLSLSATTPIICSIEPNRRLMGKKEGRKEAMHEGRKPGSKFSF